MVDCWRVQQTTEHVLLISFTANQSHNLAHDARQPHCSPTHDGNGFPNISLCLELGQTSYTVISNAVQRQLFVICTPPTVLIQLISLPCLPRTGKG